MMVTLSQGIVDRNFAETAGKLEVLTVAELAYLAGLFDGEGCVAIYSKSDHVQFTYAMHIANTDYRVIEWIVSKIGGAVTKHGGIRAMNSKHKECYVWYLMNGRAAEFLRAIRKYTVIKSEQIDLALELRKTCRFDRRGQLLPVDVLEKRNRLIDEIRTLKKVRHEKPP